MPFQYPIIIIIIIIIIININCLIINESVII
jgi:hypothetical protein